MSTQPKITADIIADHGLAPDEYQSILKILGREPNLVELGIFSAMWSEHCSYKSSRMHLAKLPTEAPWVIQGPGENAGVIDIGDGYAAIFKMESHNSPSMIEPYHGAATGVGGIMRDVFTMGARPIAMVNTLSIGAADHPRSRELLRGAVAGIAGYGNSIGTATVAGELRFHHSYNNNILVNAMCVGLAKADRIFYSAAAGIGNPVVYVGSKTGPDGIHGATMSSAELDDTAERPTVQVGDPFLEKLLIEACLELMETDVIVSIQDMGAAGLTSSAVEMASKGGVGIRLDMDKVPVREDDMTPYEIMLSESQERMLMVLKPGAEQQAAAIFRKWRLDFAVIGELTDNGRLQLVSKGEMVCDLPLDPIGENAPKYDRPWVPTPAPQPLQSVPDSADIMADLLRLMHSPDLCSRQWVWQQYDHVVGGDTIQRPGGDAALVRVHGTSKALAITADVTPRYCFADPEMGGRQAVAESWRNITAVGATPLAITDCMNFGAPIRPEIMGQFVGAIDGIADACRALDYPVISGNVSLFNETDQKAIQPTPSIGAVGVIADWQQAVDPAFKAQGDEIWLVGARAGHLGQSIWLREIHGREDGPPPPVDLETERQAGDWVREQILSGQLNAVHDVSDGGLLVAIAEMALHGDKGATIEADAALPPAAWAFGEDQGCYVISCAAGTSLPPCPVPLVRIGQVGGTALEVTGHGAVSIADIRDAHESWLPKYMTR